jgi:hypothetical protein
MISIKRKLNFKKIMNLNDIKQIKVLGMKKT